MDFLVEIVETLNNELGNQYAENDMYMQIKMHTSNCRDNQQG